MEEEGGADGEQVQHEVGRLYAGPHLHPLLRNDGTRVHSTYREGKGDTRLRNAILSTGGVEERGEER